MGRSSRHRAGLTLPFGLMGLVGAWLVSDYFGLGLDRAEGDARGGLVLLAPTLSAALGYVLSARRVRRRGWVTALVALLGTVVVGAIVGTYCTWLRMPSDDVTDAMERGIPTGVSTALAFLPFVWGIATLARRVGRARAGSIIDEADGRRVWSVIAFGVAIACPFVIGGGEHSSNFSLRSTNSLGLIATAVLFVGLVLDVIDAKRVRRAALDVLDMREVEMAGVEVEDVVDLGLGEDAFEALARGGTAYRTNERPVRAVLGTPTLATAALGRSILVSAMMLALAAIATATATFSVS